MGYRFSLENINIVGHLTEGNFLTFIENTFYSDDSYFPTIDYLRDLTLRPRGKFYTNDYYFDHVENEFRSVWEKFSDFEYELRKYIGNFKFSEEIFVRNELRALDYFLREIHRFIGMYRVKALLLPGFNESAFNAYLTSENTLKDLLSWHPHDSVLILQTKDLPDERTIYLYNVFRHFRSAATHVDKWPGVLLWSGNNSVFVPISEKQDLRNIFNVIHAERNCINFLKHAVQRKCEMDNYAYILHLSDLHFGSQTANRHRTRLLSILDNQFAEIEEDCKIQTVITGDLLNTPTESNMVCYQEFVQLLTAKGVNEPVTVLGNHDVNKQGFIKSSTKEKTIIEAFSNSRRVEVIEPLKLAFVKFFSNTGGNLAQGLIGESQMSAVGSELDKMQNKSSYTFIAILHHHPKSIDEPTWKAREWYERLLGGLYEKTMSLVDADIFLEWLERRNIYFVMHGHKHIPKIHRHRRINIISAGSSTGVVKHKDKRKTYITYNILKYDVRNKRPVSCAIHFEDLLGAGVRHLQIAYF